MLIGSLLTRIKALCDELYAPIDAVGGGEANTASNVGAGGVGFFKQKSGVDLQFKNLNAGSNKVTISDDPGNNEIDIDVAEGNFTLNNLGGTLGSSKGGTGINTSASTGIPKGPGEPGPWTPARATCPRVPTCIIPTNAWTTASPVCWWREPMSP